MSWPPDRSQECSEAEALEDWGDYEEHPRRPRKPAWVRHQKKTKSKKTKRCKTCKQEVSISDFEKFKSSTNGKQYLRGTCNPCNNAKREKSRRW